MNERPLYQTDAFAEKALTGHPAAVMPLEACLPDSLLQAIVQENNLSETAFFVPDGEGYRLRWFTREVLGGTDWLAVFEDPVTGSAHCRLAPYWASRTGRDHFQARQGLGRGGRIGCRLRGERVELTGRAAT